MKNFYDDIWMTFLIGFLINIVLLMFMIYALLLSFNAYQNSADFEYVLVVFVAFTILADVCYTLVIEILNIQKFANKNKKVVPEEFFKDNCENEDSGREKLEKAMSLGKTFNQGSNKGSNLQGSQKSKLDKCKSIEMEGKNDNKMGQQIIIEGLSQDKEFDEQNEADANLNNSLIRKDDKNLDPQTKLSFNNILLETPSKRTMQNDSVFSNIPLIDVYKPEQLKDKKGKILFNDTLLSNEQSPTLKPNNSTQFNEESRKQSVEDKMAQEYQDAKGSYINKIKLEFDSERDINLTQGTGSSRLVVARDPTGHHSRQLTASRQILPDNKGDQK